MKRTMTLAVVLCLLVVCPLFARENRASARQDQTVACDPEVSASAAERPSVGGTFTTSSRAGRPSGSVQTLDDGGCGFSCWSKILISTDFGQDVAPYPAFWVKVAACTAKCEAMQ